MEDIRKYKLIKPEYNAAVREIIIKPRDPGYYHFGLIDFDSNFTTVEHVIGNDIEDKLKKAGVLDLWFKGAYF